jgi:hypothetical protein
METEITLWLVLTAMGVSIALVWAFLDARKSSGINRRQELLHRWANEAGLALTSVEPIAGGLMGFDSVQGVLLVLLPEGYRPKCNIIRLADVASSMVLTMYKVLRTATSNLYTLSKLIDKVALQFHFVNGDQPLLIPFYCARHQKVDSLPEREARAREWHQFLVSQEEEQSDRA